MRTALHFRSVLGLAALGGLLGLASVTAAQNPPQTPPTPAKETRAKEASVPAKAREIALPVNGLTKEGVAALRADLLALSNQVYICPSCTHEQPVEGLCTKCKTTLVPETRPLFTAVGSSPQENVLTLTADPHSVVRLSRVESALAAKSVKIDDERFTLSGRAQLYVQPAVLGDVAAIERALSEAKLFDEVKAQVDPVTNQITVTVRAESSAPTRAKVNAALATAQARLTDVTWGQPLPKS